MSYYAQRFYSKSIMFLFYFFSGWGEASKESHDSRSKEGVTSQ